jgi:hypothetical protein
MRFLTRLKNTVVGGVSPLDLYLIPGIKFKDTQQANQNIRLSREGEQV